jgi:TonB family protein
MTRVALATVLLFGALRAGAQQPDAPPAQLSPPELVGFVAADYPPAALAAGKAATVSLEIVVDTEGHSTEVTVVTPAGDGFDEAAVAAARAFTWKPGQLGGIPVNVRIRYDYRFEPPAPPPPAATSAVTGVVRERGTRAPLPFADVAIAKGGDSEPVASAITDETGVFRLSGLPAGSYQITVAAAGHVRASFAQTLGDAETVDVTIRLEPTDANPYATVVEGERPGGEIERHSATAEEAKRTPGSRGDALRVVDSFPGVARPPFGIGALVVRGSNPEDTTSYLAGQEQPLIYHFGGVVSVVNSDLLERIDFLPGNFSARYGRATGGVVLADLRAPRTDRWGGYIAVSPLDTSLLVEGPLGEGSLAIAARRSYVDLVLNAIVPSAADIGLTVAPVYWDYQVIWTTPALGGQLTVTALGSSDRLALLLKKPSDVDAAVRGALEQSTYIQRVIATYRRKLGEDTKLSATLTQGTTGLKANIGQALSLEVVQFPFEYRVEIVHQAAPWLEVTAGAEGLIYPFHAQARGARPPAEGEVPTPTSLQEQLRQDSHDWELRQGVYAEAAFHVGDFTITPGVRLDTYRLIHAVAFDPRLTAVWAIGAGRLRAGFGRYSRSVEEFQSDPVFGNPDLTPQHALHASVGYDHQIAPGVRFESTLYGKWLYDQVVRSDALVTRANGSQTAIGYVNDGVGRVYGVELLLRGGVGPVIGWITYGLSRAERRDEPGEPYRLFSFDQTHSLTVIAGIKLPWGIFAGARFRYATGNPTTPITGSIFDADSDSYTPVPGATNSERLEAYHELDLRFERSWLFDSWKLTGFLDLANVYNRRNPEGYSYSYDYRQREVLGGLPILPSFGIKGEF